MAGTLYLQLLGGLRIAQDEQAVTGFVSNKARALFCYLVVTRRAHLRSALAAFFWGDHAQQAANANLRVTLSNLHQLLGPYLTITRDTVAFNPNQPYWADIELFQQTLPATSGTGEVTLGRLQEAVDLYTGAFLQGFYVRDAPDFNEWMLAQREEQRQLALEGLHRLVLEYSSQNKGLNAIALLRRLLDLDPWSEEAHRELMRLLARKGQRDTALIQYQTCQRILAEELGVEPTPETTELYQQIRGGVFNATPLRGQAAASLSRPPTPLLGRTSEVEQISAWLMQPSCRMVTLYGPGGVGKTRLALEVAAQLTGTFSDGVFCVDLAPLMSADEVGDIVAEAVAALATSTGRLRPSAEEVLRGRHVLLVLDNFEHVLPAARRLAQLLAACPKLTILVTSRVVLSLRGARNMRVQPLELPDLERLQSPETLLQNPAVALFVERARAVNPSFRLAEHTTEAVVEICRRLDGLPLAIELAATRTHVLPPAALLERSGSWMKLLTGGSWDQPSRHQTLRDAIAWSYQLLKEQEQRLFRWLCIFPAEFTLAAAETMWVAMGQPGVAGLDGITVLVNNSLLMLVDDHDYVDAGEPRFAMLQTTRSYGLELIELSGEAVPRWHGEQICSETPCTIPS